MAVSQVSKALFLSSISLSQGNPDRTCLASWTLFVDKPVDLGAPSQVPTGISMLIIIFAIIYLLIQNPTRPHILFSPPMHLMFVTVK